MASNLAQTPGSGARSAGHGPRSRDDQAWSHRNFNLNGGRAGFSKLYRTNSVYRRQRVLIAKGMFNDGAAEAGEPNP
jgi:hypothetical protein